MISHAMKIETMVQGTDRGHHNCGHDETQKNDEEEKRRSNEDGDHPSYVCGHDDPYNELDHEKISKEEEDHKPRSRQD